MEPAAEDIQRQLDRILASEGFINAERMTRFLRYVVERSLAGESDQVKEYVIGLEVFGRDAAYDPRLDSIVRVEARRLRAKLDEYYAGVGSNDPLIIQLRRGSYVPAFVARRQDSAAAVGPPDLARHHQPVSSWRRWRVGLPIAIAALLVVTFAARRNVTLWDATALAPKFSVAVLPFHQFSSDPDDERLAANLTDGVTTELARIGSLAVVSHTTALQVGSRKSIKEIAQTLGVDVIVEGAVRRDGTRIEADVRLVNAATDRKIWTHEFVGDTHDLHDLQQRIAAAIGPAALAAQEAR
jgi:TolB-like protein